MPTRQKLILVTLISLFFVLEVNVLAETEGNSVLKENDYMEAYTLEDQHGTLRTLQKDTETIILSFDMKLSKTFHKWLKDEESNYLINRNTEYIIDITGMPSIITWLFAGPKMRKYGFRILLIKEGDFGDRIPKQEGKFTMIKLDENHKVIDISFLDKIDAIRAYIE
ncbi:MAG: hypothetical protein ACUZ8E_00780 [Candidatus Anammoxibacter sp.]